MTWLSDKAESRLRVFMLVGSGALLQFSLTLLASGRWFWSLAWATVAVASIAAWTVRDE